MKHGNIFLTEAEYTNFIDEEAVPGYYTSIVNNDSVFDYIEPLMHIYSDNTVALTFLKEDIYTYRVQIVFILKENYDIAGSYIFTGTDILYFATTNNNYLRTMKYEGYISNPDKYELFNNGTKVTLSTNSGFNDISYKNSSLLKHYTSYKLDVLNWWYALPIIPHLYEIKRPSTATGTPDYISFTTYFERYSGNKSDGKYLLKFKPNPIAVN